MIGAFLVTGTAGWPAWIYLRTGLMTASQVSLWTEPPYASALLEPGDENLFQNPVHKKFVQKLIQEKPAFDDYIESVRIQKGRKNSSKALIYLKSVSPYTWDFFLNHFYQMVPAKSQVDCYKQIFAITAPIIKKHRCEYYKIIIRSFLSAFDYYNDLNYPFFCDNLPKISQLAWLSAAIDKINSSNFLWGKTLNFYIFMFTYIFIVFTIIFAKNSRLRQPLAFIASMHPIHCAILAYGVCVHERYLDTTQWSLTLCVLLSIYIWGKTFYDKFSTAYFPANTDQEFKASFTKRHMEKVK